MGYIAAKVIDILLLLGRVVDNYRAITHRGMGG